MTVWNMVGLVNLSLQSQATEQIVKPRILRFFIGIGEAHQFDERFLQDDGKQRRMEGVGTDYLCVYDKRDELVRIDIGDKVCAWYFKGWIFE